MELNIPQSAFPSSEGQKKPQKDSAQQQKKNPNMWEKELEIYINNFSFLQFKYSFC